MWHDEISTRRSNMKIEILGSGCRNCVRTAERIEQVTKELGIEADVEKVTDPEVMLAYRIMRTPAVAIDGKLVHSAGVPDHEMIRGWFR